MLSISKMEKQNFVFIPKFPQSFPNVCVTSQKQLHPSSAATQRIGNSTVLLHGSAIFNLSHAVFCAVGNPLASHNLRSNKVYVCP